MKFREKIEASFEALESDDPYCAVNGQEKVLEEILDAVRELVAEAKPKIAPYRSKNSAQYSIQQTIDEYEENLLGALGEK